MFTITKEMQRVRVQTSPDRFMAHYGSCDGISAREYTIPLPDAESSVAVEIKILEPTKWPVRIRRFETHSALEVIVTFDQPVVIVVKHQPVDFFEAFLIEPFTEVTILAEILHGWILPVSAAKTRILVIYPVENEELLLEGEFSPPTIILPEGFSQE